MSATDSMTMPPQPQPGGGDEVRIEDAGSMPAEAAAVPVLRRDPDDLMSPEEIAKMTSTAMEACFQASDQLKALGAKAVEMAEMFNARCISRANQLVVEGNSVCDNIKNFAGSILDQAEQVDSIAEYNGVKQPKKPLPKFLQPQQGR